MIIFGSNDATASMGVIYTNKLFVSGSITLPTYSVSPSAGDTGSIYYNTTDGNIYRSNGSTWSVAAGTSGTSGTTGTSGTSGTNGTAGSSGTSGANGSSGSSGTSGGVSIYSTTIGDNLATSFGVTHSLGSVLVSVHMLNTSTQQIYYPTAQTSSVLRGSFHGFIDTSNTLTIKTPYTASVGEFTVVVKT